MHELQLVLVVAALLIRFDSAFAFANLLLKDCDKSIDLDEPMMGSPVSVDFTRVIEVFHVRDGQQEAVVNGTTVDESEKFLVKIQPSTNQCAFEVRGNGARFPQGKCGQNRRALCGNTKGVLLEIEGNVKGSIEIVAAWGLSFSSGVKLSAPFIFKGSPHEDDKTTAKSLEL